MKKMSKFFISLLLSSFAVMLLPTLAAILLAINSLNIANNEIEKTIDQAFAKIQQQIEDTYLSCLQLSYRNTVSNSILNYSSSQQRNYISEYQINQALKSSFIGIDNVELCYLYLPQFEYVVSSTSGKPSEDFFSSHYGGTYEEWLKTINVKSRFSIDVLPSKENELYGLAVMVYRASLNNSANIPAVVVTQIDSNILQKSLISLLHSDKDIFLIKCKDKIISTNADSESAKKLFSALSESNKPISAQINNVGYKLHYSVSTKYGVELAYCAPSKIFANPAFFSASYILFVVLFCILLTIFVGIWLAQKNYMPVKKILSLIGDVKINTDEYKGENEFLFIESSIKQYMNKISQLTENKERQINEFQEMYLIKLLLGNVRDVSSISEFMTLYNINFGKKYFSTVLFEVTDDSLLFNDDTLDELERGQLSKIIIQNIVVEMFQEIGICYLVEIYDHYVCIINTDNKNMEETRRLIAELTQKAINFISENFSLNFYTHISDIYDDVYKLKDAYEQIKFNESNIVSILSDDTKSEVPDEFVEKCTLIIREKYSDNNLCVTSIAEEISMNPAYVSRYFKQQTGVGLLDYIHHYRLVAAKLLMQENPNTLIKDVAEKCGFYNVAALIRVFKKIEGITPGQFRDILLNGKK